MRCFPIKVTARGPLTSNSARLIQPAKSQATVRPFTCSFSSLASLNHFVRTIRLTHQYVVVQVHRARRHRFGCPRSRSPRTGRTDRTSWNDGTEWTERGQSLYSNSPSFPTDPAPLLPAAANLSSGPDLLPSRASVPGPNCPTHPLLSAFTISFYVPLIYFALLTRGEITEWHSSHCEVGVSLVLSLTSKSLIYAYRDASVALSSVVLPYMPPARVFL